MLNFLAENRVYSWGRGDNGSLGIPMANIKKKKKDDVPVTSLPKPIFGSLHAVTSLACRYWHTIIVADRVLGSRAIKTPSATNSPRSREYDGKPDTVLKCGAPSALRMRT